MPGRGRRAATSAAYDGDAGCPRSVEPVSIFEKILRAGEGRMVRRLHVIANAVNSLEDHYTELSDDELRELTDQYRERFEEGETLDDLLPEAFATVREAARRVLGQRHFDVQLMGGAAIHFGNIAEMKT